MTPGSSVATTGALSLVVSRREKVSPLFFDQGEKYTPEGLVDDIQRDLAAGKYHVRLSHMWAHGLKGGMKEWFEKTERFADLLAERKIPTMTMSESLEARFGKSGRK